MVGIKILFADDQIPDENIPDDQIRAVLKKEHPDWDSDFIVAFEKMREAVQKLDDAGYGVTIARTVKDALEAIRNNHFDIAIVDLNWFADHSISWRNRLNMGWSICTEIEKVNKTKKSGEPKTFQIMYSSRFSTDPELSREAAGRGILPVFKVYGEPGHEALKAAIKFIEWNLSSPDQIAISAAIESQRLMMKSLVEPLEQQRLWFRLTMAFVVISVSLLLVGAVSVMFGNLEAGVLTSLGSIFTSVISSLLFVQLQRTQKLAETNRKEIEKIFNKTVVPLLEDVRGKKVHKS